MKKNSKIHLWLETSLKESIEKQAKEEGVSVCEFCRKKLKENSKLNNIEFIVGKILEEVQNRKIYKDGLR